MTPQDVIKRINNIKPSVIESSVLLSFLNKIEAKIREDINGEENFTPYKFENIETDKLFLDDKFSEIYTFYLSAKIDLFSNNIASHNNFIILYNNALAEFYNYVQYRKKAANTTYQYDYEGAFK